MQELIEQLRKDVARGARNVDKARQALAILDSMEMDGEQVAGDCVEITMVSCPNCGNRLHAAIVSGVTHTATCAWCAQHKAHIPPPPAPTPAAPDPGPGWRLKEVGEMITKGDQWLNCNGWGDVTMTGLEKVIAQPLRTPIYHNPANLETAGEGYRFCLVSEARQDATEYWLPISKEWVRVSMPNGDDLSIHDTYRTNKPLPTT